MGTSEDGGESEASATAVDTVFSSIVLAVDESSMEPDGTPLASITESEDPEAGLRPVEKPCCAMPFSGVVASVLLGS